ncbi:MAG: hypothetical protein NZM31_09625 [Gemmatales bacterium]|nr:hypothetical protein [Gemmatales bacterium]MDW8387253.1 hypothetical protein [Gemmatales bacterium]
MAQRIVCLVLMLCSASGLGMGRVEAAWLGFRNDTEAAVVIQTGSLVGNRLVPGVPQRLLPGETSWEWVGEESRRQVRVSVGGQLGSAARGLEASVGKLDVLYAIRVRRLANGETFFALEKVWEGRRRTKPGIR